MDKSKKESKAEKSGGMDQSLLDKATEALGGSKPGRPKHGMRNMHVDHHADGSHTVRHTPHEGEEISYAVKNTKELQDKIKQYLGGGEAAEEAAEGKQDSPAEESAEKV
jgi:hypothetical protein